MKRRRIINLYGESFVEAKSLRRSDPVVVAKQFHIVERVNVHDMFTYVHYSDVGLKRHFNNQLIKIVK